MAGVRLPTLNWIPAPGTDFLVWRTIEKPVSFRYWVAACHYDPNCPEVVALAYLPEYEDVATNMIAWVLWVIVNIQLGSVSPFPDKVEHVVPQLCPPAANNGNQRWLPSPKHQVSIQTSVLRLGKSGSRCAPGFSIGGRRSSHRCAQATSFEESTSQRASSSYSLSTT